LLAQVYYKLSEYPKAIKCYEQVLELNANSEEALDSDEIADIITNYLACQSQTN
jgi:tetratricopeptide (TPR) repeat protein